MSEANAIVHELAEAARTGALDGALAERTFPVVGEDWALFVHRGAADEVKLHHWIHGIPSERPFVRHDGTELWTLEMEVQRNARVEYKLEIAHGGHHQLVRDALNPNLAHDPFGANSVVQGLGYVEPEWANEDPRARRGEVVERQFKSDVYGDVRPISIYLPARFRETRRYPLLVFHDGLEYLRFTNLATVLDNLIHRLEIPPLVAALTQSPDRMNEYAADERQPRFLVDELLPLLQDEFPLLEEPRDRALIGASFGAVATLHAACSRPGAFGKLLLQSEIGRAHV